jgi:hypothetical protein
MCIHSVDLSLLRLLPNCLFRCNGAAMLLTNKPKKADQVFNGIVSVVTVSLMLCIYQVIIQSVCIELAVLCIQCT